MTITQISLGYGSCAKCDFCRGCDGKSFAELSLEKEKTDLSKEFFFCRRNAPRVLQNDQLDPSYFRWPRMYGRRIADEELGCGDCVRYVGKEDNK